MGKVKVVLFCFCLLFLILAGLAVEAGAEEENPVSIDGFVYPTEGEAPLNVFFNTSAYSEVGSIISYKWYFREDEEYDWHSPLADNTFHIYEKPGTYQAKLVAEDNRGNQASKEFEIEVLVPEPEVDYFIFPSSGRAPLNTYFSVEVDHHGLPGVIYELDFTGDGKYEWSSEHLTTCFMTEEEYMIENWEAEGSWGKTNAEYVSEPYGWADSPETDYENDSNYSLTSPEIDISESSKPYL